MRTLALVILAGSALLADEPFRKHNITLGMGAGTPRADLSSFLSTSFGLDVGYGYRFFRYVQADAGLETLFGAAGVRSFLDTDFGPRRIRDYQFLVPLGGRVILPLARERLLIYGSGGGAYLRYTELLSQPSEYIRYDCSVCTSRSGWASYAGAGFSVALDRSRNFRLGVGGRVYRGHTDGDPLGAVPAVRTTDRWVNVMAQFAICF